MENSIIFFAKFIFLTGPKIFEKALYGSMFVSLKIR